MSNRRTIHIIIEPDADADTWYGTKMKMNEPMQIADVKYYVGNKSERTYYSL